MIARRTCVGGLLAAVALGAFVATIQAQVVYVPDKYGDPAHGQVNISGATLFEDFFGKPASTNDYIDADGDGTAGKLLSWPPQNLATPYPSISGSGGSTFWLVNYRGTGSVNGLNEFFDFQACGLVPTSLPSTAWINQQRYVAGGVKSFDPIEPMKSIGLAVLDVPIGWGTINGDAAGAQWNRAPSDPGYGQNPYPSSTGFSYTLAQKNRDCNNDGTADVTFNTNKAAPDAWTLFDTPVAWVPIAFIANEGTGIENVKVTELQHLYVTGRMPSGENLVAATRTPFSGTRNGAMNSIGVDPSWGRGDNLGNEVVPDRSFQLDPLAQPTNAEGSGGIEVAVQNWRLAVGYSGLGGSSRAAKDAKDGKYEVINVMFDDRGGTQFVRPTVGSTLDNILDNADATKGWQVGGPETFVSLGDPLETDTVAVSYMRDRPAADYLKNLLESIANFVSVPTNPANDAMPGEYLATAWFLIAGVDALPDLDHPTQYMPQAVNTSLQEYMRAKNGLGFGGDTPAFGTATVAGRVPVRNVGLDTNGDGLSDTPYDYTDGGGSTAGSTPYAYCNGSTVAFIAGGAKLGSRSRISGDFNADGLRNTNDVEAMVAAYFQPRTWSVGAVGACVQGPLSGKADQVINTIITEVVGDFNGDGDFSKEDLRYFMDGLAVDPSTGKLDRKAGAVAIDTAILQHAPVIDEYGNAVVPGQFLPWADTRASTLLPPATPGSNPTHLLPAPISGFLTTGKAYKAGDFRGDVAGGTPVRGARPSGWDGKVDCQDIRYVYANFGQWSDLDQAALIDLSADMNGDLVIDVQDAKELVESILQARSADANVDGVCDASDDPRTLAHWGAAGGWCDGDFNFDGMVNEVDLGIWTACTTPCTMPVVVSAVSRKTQGAGDFDIDLIVAGAVESRLGGPTQVVVTFDQPVQAVGGVASPANVSVSSGTVTQVTIAGPVLTVDLADADNASLFTLGFPGIQSLCAEPVTQSSCFKVLVGDVDGSGVVNLSDMLAIRDMLNQMVSASNFRADVDASGKLDLADMLAVRDRLNTRVAASCP